MAIHQYTSPGGAVYEFEGPDELTPELQKQIQESVALNESDTNQGPLATFGNATMQGLAQTATGTVGGAGALINTLTGSAGADRSGLSTWADEMQRGAELNFPTNPANPVATGLGQAVGQGVGMMGTSALGLPIGNARTVANLGLGMAGLMGAQQGEQTADEFGITDPLKRAAMVGGFGAIEAGTEAIGGIGSTKFAKSLLKDVPSVLETGVESSAIKRALHTAVGEGGEEVLSGELQDITTKALAEEDPNNPGYSINGQPLPELASLSTLKNRGQEFLYGMAGGLVPGGVHAAFGTSTGDVMEYRQAVAEKRRDGKVLPEEDERVAQLDTKAQEYLRKAGISDEDQASAILAHLQRSDKTRNIVVEAAEKAEATAPSVAEALNDLLEETDRKQVLADVDAAVQAIEPKPVEEEKPKQEVTPPVADEGKTPAGLVADPESGLLDLGTPEGDLLTGIRQVKPLGGELLSNSSPEFQGVPIEETTPDKTGVIADERTKVEQREAPSVEPVSTEETPEPVVEEPAVTTPVQVVEPTVTVADPEPVPAGALENRTGSPEQLKNVDAFATDLAGKVVFQQGDVALIRGYSVLTGEPVYAGIKGGYRTRGDITSYKGDLFTAKETRQLLEQKQSDKQKDEASYAKTPFVVFDKGVSFSPSFPKGLASVAKEWYAMLGLKGNIYFTTSADAVANKDKFNGPHAAIGSIALVSKKVKGQIRQLSDGSSYLMLDEQLGRIQQLETLAHELGHRHEREVFSSSSEETKEAIRHEFEKWLTQNKSSSAKTLIESLRARQTAKKTLNKTSVGGAADIASSELSNYWKSFGEWYADQVSRWAVSNDRPLTVVEKFFSRLARTLKAFYESVKGKGWLPNETFTQYLRSTLQTESYVDDKLKTPSNPVSTEETPASTAPIQVVDYQSGLNDLGSPEGNLLEGLQREEPKSPATVTETYKPEPLPPDAVINPNKQQNKGTSVGGRYSVVTYTDVQGNKQTRAYFTNDPVVTFNQIAAGLEIPVPDGLRIHPDIKVADGKVIGVNRVVNGSTRFIENRKQANQSALDDTTAAKRSEAQRPAAEKRKAATFAAKAQAVGTLPPFPGESSFVTEPLLARIKTIAGKFDKLDSVARENLEADILSRLVEIKRVGAFVQSQPGETQEEKRQAALDTPEAGGNSRLYSLIKRYDVSQEDNLSYIKDLVFKAAADSKKTVKAESLDATESGITEDVSDDEFEEDGDVGETEEDNSGFAEPVEDKLGVASDVEVNPEEEKRKAAEKLEGVPEKLKEIILANPAMIEKINTATPEQLAKYKEAMLSAKAERIKAGYRSVRSIMEETDRLGLKDGQPKSILTALQRIADNKTGDNYHPHIVYVARALSKLTDSLSKIQDLRFSTANALHAASYRASDHSISLNLGTAWGEQQTVGEILVHEVGHALTSIKLNDPQTQYDKALAGEIEGMRSQISDYLSNVRPADAERFAYQLSNADEFVAGVFSNPPFVELLASLPERLVAGTPVSTKSNFFTSLLRKLWNLMLGKAVTPGSPLERAMDAVFSLAETPFTIPTAENVLRWAGIEKNFPAYHGTPHKVDKFSTEKIGTGEGEQAYGWGLYFAANWGVAESYRKQLAFNTDVEQISRAKEFLRKFHRGTNPDGLYGFDDEGNYIHKAAELGFKREERGAVYTVEILPDESEFLDWDKPLSEQSERVKGALKATGLFTARDINPPSNFVPSPLFNSGRGAYDVIKAQEGSPEKASLYLSSLGVAGIKYFDGNSRNIEYGTRNFVIFDDKDVKITHENGTPVTEQERSDFLDQHLNAAAAPSSKESLPGEHRELIVEAMRALPAGYTLNTDTSSDSPVWVRRSRPGVVFANPGILAAEVAGLSDVRRAEVLRALVSEEVAHTEDLKELGDDEARRIARELAPETRAWINDMYGQDLNDIETVFEGFRMLRQRMRNGATTEEIRAFAASDPNFARRFLEYLRRMWKRLMANLDQDKTLANIKAVRSLVGGIDTLESLAVGEDDTKLGVSPWAWIRDQVKSTAGTVTSHRTKAPWFATQDENTPYKATGVAFGSGRKNVSIAEAERVKNAINTAEGRALTVLDRDIKAAAVKTMGSWDAAKALVGEAIGNNDNRMDYDQRKQYEKDHADAARAALSTYQSELGAARALENQGDYAGAATLKQAAQSKFKTDVSLAKDDFDHKVQQAEALARQQALAKQAAAMQSLPTELRDAVQRARDRMDALTTEFINKGYGSDDLRATLSNNLGLYLHRSYSAFDSPHWSKWVMGKNPEAVRLRNKVETLIKTDLTAKKAAELIKANPSLSQQAAIVQAQGLLNDNEIEAKIQELLENSPDEFTSLVQGDGFKNGKPSSVIKRRGEIHPWIQEFWGKHDDPLLNISKSIGLTHAYLAQQSMLRTILNDGVRDGYIFDDVGKARGLVALKDKTEENMRRYPSLFRKDANGKIIGEWFVSPLVRDAIEDLEPKADTFGPVWNVFRALTGYSMAAKTVYSPMALVRDFLSNITILGIHGHMTPGLQAGASPWAQSLVANAREVGFDRLLQAVLSPVRGNKPLLSDKQAALFDKLHFRTNELGVTGNNMVNEVVKELTKESSKRFELRGKDVNRAVKAIHAGLSHTAEFFTETRALSDDVPKMIAWLNEVARLSKFHPNMTQEEAEVRAAEKVRMYMPSQSETSDLVKYWRKQPFFSPFVTFSGEIVRTMINTYKLGAQEMKSDSFAEKALGLHRMAMMTAMITVLPAIIQSAVSKFRPEDDPPVKTDELATALPRFVSGWQKENMLLWLGKEGNKHTYLDLSYLAPYDVIHGILTGTARELFTNPDNVTIPGKVSAALQKAFDEATKPVAKEQLLTGAIIDTMRNQREPGDKFGLYNDKLATGWEKWTARLSNVWQQALEPGIVKSTRGVIKGWNQEVDNSGRAYEFWNEVRSLFGAKTMSQDIPTRLMRNGNGYARDLSDATMYASQPFSSAGTQDDETLIKAFARMNEAKLKVVGEIRKDWLAAQSLGMTAEEATKSLAISHLPKDMLTAAVSNEYVREPLSKQLLEKAAANGQALGQDRMALYRRAVEAYPVKQKVLPY